MPYIRPERRKRYDPLIDLLARRLFTADGLFGEFPEGDLNYVISRIVGRMFSPARNYLIGNRLVGVLECVKQEFYRRQLTPYEDEKIKEHGDL